MLMDRTRLMDKGQPRFHRVVLATLTLVYIVLTGFSAYALLHLGERFRRKRLS